MRSTSTHTPSLLYGCLLLMLSGAGFGASLIAQVPPTLQVEKLGPPINTDEYDEMSPVLSRDGRQLFFTRAGSPDYNRSLLYNGSDAKDSLGDGGYERLLRQVYRQIGERSNEEVWRSRFNQDVWMAEFDGEGTYLSISHPDTPLNNALPNALSSAFPEPGHYLVINQFPKRGGLSKGFSHIYRRGDGSWSWPEPVEIDDYYTHSDGVGVTLSEDGETMILSLNRAGGFGRTDLYVSHRLDSMHWSKPQNLGRGINTEFREATPSLSEDKQTLYFSSNRWGRGGNDLYFCRRLDTTWNNWSLARRFKPPISSEGDDSQPYFNEATGFLYFTSKRDGSSDIYRVQVQPARPLDILVAGRVLHARTGEPIDADVAIRQRGYAGIDTVTTTNGRFDYRITSLSDLIISANKPGYLGHVERLNLRRQSYLEAYEVTILLDPLEKGGIITLDPIFFKQSLAEVKPSSIKQLDRLRDVLQKYPNVYVRIEGHTDNQGPSEALAKLSRERAQAIRSYLIEQGIDRTRVQAAGLGPSKPIASNETPAGREENRRVEVVITRILPQAVKVSDSR